MELEQLKTLSSAKIFKAGKVIIQDGDTEADSMYIVLKGRVGVYKNHGKPNETLVTTLEPGDFFGEMALFLNEPRMATVAAQEDVLTLEINRLNVNALL